jgi:hypothetical protein
MGYSGDSGSGCGDFLARILVSKGEEGRLSETGWIIVEQIGGFWTLIDMLAYYVLWGGRIGGFELNF